MNGLAHSTIRDTPLLLHLARIVASPGEMGERPGQGGREGGSTLGGGMGRGSGGGGRLDEKASVAAGAGGGNGGDSGDVSGGVSGSVSPSLPGLDTQSLSLCLHALAVLNVGGGEEGRRVSEAVVRRIVSSDWRLHSSAGLANIAWAAAVLQQGLPRPLLRHLRGCIYICMYIYVVYIYVCVCVCVCVCARARVRIVCIYVYVCIYMCIYVYVGWIFEGLYWHTAGMDPYSLNQV